MNSVKEVYGNRWTAWWRRNSTVLQVAATISCNLGYLLETGYTRTAAALSMVSLGGATLYYISKRRWKIKPRDLVVITGCNSGLGYSLAMHCRAQGATVLAGVRETAVVLKPNAVVESLKDRGVIVHQLDITSEESVREFGEKVKQLSEERQLALRALVNNAGVMVFGEFEWQTQELAEYQLSVNLLGTMRITRELMPIIRRNGGRIVVVSSHCAADPLPGISVYAATKAALHAWATALRVEVGKYGVNVVSFIPFGFYCTDADAKSLEPRVTVTLMGVKINYPYPEKDACKSLKNGECPLKKDEKATYNLEMPIDKSLPSVSLNIEFALVDENKNTQVCFNMDCEVIDK